MRCHLHDVDIKRSVSRIDDAGWDYPDDKGEGKERARWATRSSINFRVSRGSKVPQKFPSSRESTGFAVAYEPCLIPELSIRELFFPLRLRAADRSSCPRGQISSRYTFYGIFLISEFVEIFNCRRDALCKSKRELLLALRLLL